MHIWLLCTLYIFSSRLRREKKDVSVWDISCHGNLQVMGQSLIKANLQLSLLSTSAHKIRLMCAICHAWSGLLPFKREKTHRLSDNNSIGNCLWKPRERWTFSVSAFLFICQQRRSRCQVYLVLIVYLLGFSGPFYRPIFFDEKHKKSLRNQNGHWWEKRKKKKVNVFFFMIILEVNATKEKKKQEISGHGHETN